MKLGDPHVCLVQIGHYGDCINMLPIAWKLHQRGKIVHWFLEPPAKRDVLRACSYIKIVEDIPPTPGIKPLRGMLAAANERFEHVIVCSHRDKAGQGQIVCQSYNREGWRLAGFLHEFDGPVEYVIDLYNWPKRKFRFGSGKIVVNLTSGQSSPFAYGEALLKKLEAAFPEMIEDIGPLRLPNFLDLLPIIREASLFISIDTGTLWISEFLPEVPTIAIVNYADWSGSILHRHLESRLSYREVQCEPRTVIAAVERVLGFKAERGWEKTGEPKNPGHWPEVFRRGKINGESDMKLRYDAIKAWREVLDGAQPCMFFDSVMRAISNKIGIPTHELIEFGPRKLYETPNLP